MTRRELRFGLLGAPVLYDGGTEGADRSVRSIGSPKLRILLAVLLLDAGRVVSVEALKDAMWGAAPPPSAQPSLHNHVARLRRLLDDPERLVTVPTGYLLRVGEGELDVHAFDAHAAAVRVAHAGRDWRRVVRECTAALALWRGTPLAGLPPEVGGYAFVRRLDEARLLLLERRYDAELALGGGRLAGLVPELTALAAEHPLREAYHRQLMLALHRTGRRAEALAVHRDLRARLVGELGVEPGAEVREAHMEVLRGATGTGRTAASSRSAGSAGSAVSGAEPAGPGTPTGMAGSGAVTASARHGAPARAVRSPGTAPTASAAPRPAQLPPPPAHFTGRTDVRAELCRVLTPRSSPVGPAVAVVSGMAGVGKSALALHVAHTLAERFSDGQLYVNLHGATPGVAPLTPAQALSALLRDLGTDPRGVPEAPDAAAALLRSLLAPTRTLLVLDDAANAAQVRPLLPAGPGCAVIVTSRSPLTALDGAARFPLAPLTDEDSAALLRAVSGRDDLGAGHPLVALTGRLPLALRVVAARLAARRVLTPDALAGQLSATDSRLPHLEYDDLSVRRSLAVAYDALAASEREADRDAALALRRIGALDLPGYGAPLLARLTGTGERRAEAALDRLVDVALLEETAYGRYVPHDLVRDFARELTGADGGTDRNAAGRGAEGRGVEGRDATGVALRWYAAVAERALTAIVEPGLDLDDRRRPTSSQPSGHAADVDAVPPFADAEEAFAWGDRELENIVTLVEPYAGDAAGGEEGGRDVHAARLSVLLRLLCPYLQRRGRVAEWDVLGRAALRVARTLGDEAAEGYALTDLAGLYFLTGRHNDALALTDRALEIWRRLDVVSWIRRCLNNRGLLLQELGRHAESEEALRQSLTYSQQLDDPYGEAVTYSHLGNLYEHSDPRAAIEQHRRSLAMGDEIGAVIVQHSAHCNIGYAHLRLGEPAAALPHFEESLRILGGHDNWHGESQTRLGLVRALRLLGRTGRAVGECGELLGRADARADRYTGGLARHQYGLLLREQGRTREAYEQWRSALAALDGTDGQAVVGELRELLADGTGDGTGGDTNGPR
ncbi:BTAD domain-containing putative transcriptional regulator [Streptomyces sp. enrichment culture]|uniref:AfsR/SARP family transcriptional regulator n=1 Tax=Streptomyces sp. enrichment culture TaxID=1795815 RepID=UPI003F577C41